MASVKFQRGSEEWQMFIDFYKLTQTLWGREDTDEYWDSVRMLTEEFYRGHRTSFARHLANALFDTLEERKV